LGDHGEGLVYRLLREKGEILSGDLVCWGLREICNRRLWKGASFGNLEGGVRFTGDFGRLMMEDSGNGTSLSTGPLRGEPGGKAPLLGTLKGM